MSATLESTGAFARRAPASHSPPPEKPLIQHAQARQSPRVQSRRRLSSAVQNPLETYLREINETALLTADQEKELSYRINDGEKEARDQMVRANLRLVVNIARSYTGKGLPLQDLIEEGNLGLLRAVEGFDPTMNTRFSTYASYWIKQSIKRALINSAKTIRIPAYMVELLTKWRRATTKLLDELKRTPTPEEIAAELGIAKKKLRIVKKAIQLYNATPQTEQAESGWSLGRNGRRRAEQGPRDGDGRERQPDARQADARDDGQPGSDDPADAVWPGRRRTEDPEGNRRNAGPDAGARPPDRERSPRQTGRRIDGGVGQQRPRAGDRKLTLVRAGANLHFLSSLGGNDVRGPPRRVAPPDFNALQHFPHFLP